MDCIFSVSKATSPTTTSPSFNEWLSHAKPVSAVSSRNIVAFSSHTDLKDPSPKCWQVGVFVADLNIPWDVHRILTHSEDITCLEWDVTGSKLLVGDALGQIEVWSIKDNLIRCWEKVVSFSAFAGERVMTLAWFHNGDKISVVPEKKDTCSLYSEKFTNVKFGASVRQFGGRPAEGFVAISSSSLVWACVQTSDGSFVTASEIIGQYRSKINAVDICYAKNGHFLVICSNGSIESSVNCYTVSVKYSPCGSGLISKPSCTVECLHFSSFYLNANVTNAPIETYSQITHLKFILKEAAEAVVVATKGPAGSTVELWELREKPIELHSLFKKQAASDGNNGEDEAPKTVAVWQHHASDTHSSNVCAICTPRLCVLDIAPPPSYIVVAYQDGNIKCMYRESLLEVSRVSLQASKQLNENGVKSYSGNNSSNKNSSTGTSAKVCDMQFTWTGCSLVVMTALSELSIFRLPPITDFNSHNANVHFVQSMLEYCLVTGHDWWDLIFSLKPSSIEPLADLLTQAFSKQPQAVQHKYSIRFQELKGFLYRCMPASSSSSIGQVRAGDAYASIMLNAISTFLKSLIRTQRGDSQEGPAENLSSLLKTKCKELANIETFIVEHLGTLPKEFYVETSILPSLQNLTQWISDLALYLLASLPHQVHSHYRFPGGCLVNDIRTLNTLRELLVIIRIWGLINESCLPIFTRLSGDLDVIGQLFRLLTIRVSSLNSNSEPDEGFLEECYRLPNQVLVNQPELTLKARGVASPALFLPNSLPFVFNYFNEPLQTKTHIKTHVIEGAVMYNLKRHVDVIRHLSISPLQLEGPNVRKCTRCRSMSLVQSALVTRFPSIRAWDHRFSRKCICSGSWS